MTHMKHTSPNVRKLEGDGRKGEWILEKENTSIALLSHSEVEAHERALGRVGASWPATLLTVEAEATPQTCILSNPTAHYAVASLGLLHALFSSFQYRENQH